MLAKDIMTEKVISFLPETNVLEAIQVLIDNKISGAPVLDKSGNLRGIVTEKDLLVSLDFVGDKNAKEIQVNEFMTKDVATFSEDTTVAEISQKLVSGNIKRVPIMKGDKITGIVARRDILKNALKRMKEDQTHV